MLLVQYIVIISDLQFVFPLTYYSPTNKKMEVAEIEPNQFPHQPFVFRHILQKHNELLFTCQLGILRDFYEFFLTDYKYYCSNKIT